MASLTSYNSKTRHEYDSSFPPPFSGVEETYMHRLVEPSRNKVGEAEIDIFSADKYFNGNMDEEDIARKVARREYQDKKPELVHGGGDIKPGTEVQTSASVYSESSWNSQSALLRSQRNQSKAKARAPKKKFLAKFCKCACSDKNSVDVEDCTEYYKQNNTMEVASLDPADLIGIRSLSFSAVNKVVRIQQQEEERKSIEAFGSASSQDNGSRRFSIQKKMSMLAWDTTPKAEPNIEIIQGTINGQGTQDNESEASSDLFEIECLSCLDNPVVNAGRPSSCVSPTNGYALSEASVAWSVVTATAAEFSALSDSEDQLASPTTLPPKPSKPTIHVDELPKTRYGGILSGCNSQRAVRVAGDAYTAGARVKRSDSFRNVRQFQV